VVRRVPYSTSLNVNCVAELTTATAEGRWATPRYAQMVDRERMNRRKRLPALCDVLAEAYRQGRLEATDVLRVLGHERRTLNTNTTLDLPVRSTGAQKVIDDYAARKELVPKNGSPDALHADHVHRLTETQLRTLTTEAAWQEAMEALLAVVCVTAGENYRLERHEKEGANGWAKYTKAGVELFDVAADPRSDHKPGSRTPRGGIASSSS